MVFLESIPYFNTPLLMIYLSATEALIFHIEIELNRVYFLRFCTKYDTCFSEYGIELIVALSSTNPTKNIEGNHIIFITWRIYGL